MDAKPSVYIVVIETQRPARDKHVLSSAEAQSQELGDW